MSTSTTTFQVDDMSCSHCVSTIRNAFVKEMPGVDVAIDLDSKQVTVAGDSAQAAKVLRDAGYEPRL